MRTTGRGAILRAQGIVTSHSSQESPFTPPIGPESGRTFRSIRPAGRVRELLAVLVLAAIFVGLRDARLLRDSVNRVALVPSTAQVEDSRIHGFAWSLWWTGVCNAERDSFSARSRARYRIGETSPGPHQYLWGRLAAPLSRWVGPVAAANWTWLGAAVLAIAAGFLAARLSGLGRQGAALVALVWGAWLGGGRFATTDWTAAPDPWVALVVAAAVAWTRSRERRLGLLRVWVTVPLGLAVGIAILVSGGALLPAVLAVAGLSLLSVDFEDRSPRRVVAAAAPISGALAAAVDLLLAAVLAHWIGRPVLEHLVPDLERLRGPVGGSLVRLGALWPVDPGLVRAWDWVGISTVVALAAFAVLRSGAARRALLLALGLGACARWGPEIARVLPGTWIPLPLAPEAFFPWIALLVCLATAAGLERSRLLEARGGVPVLLCLAAGILGLSRARIEPVGGLDVAQALRAIEGEGVVAGLPIGPPSGQFTLLQTVHGRSTLRPGGAVALGPDPARTSWPSDLDELAHGRAPGSAEGLEVDLAAFGVAQILVPLRYLERDAEAWAVLDQLERWERGEADGFAWWYRLDESPAVSAASSSELAAETDGR